MNTASRSDRKVQLAFGAAILSLLVVGAMSYRMTFLSGESDRWVRHTHEVLENLQDLLSAAENMESGDRGFALTGNASYLQSYRASAVSAKQSAATVRILTADNLTQQRQLSELEGLAAEKV